MQSSSTIQQHTQILFEAIIKKAFVRHSPLTPVALSYRGEPQWIFDCKAILLIPEVLDAYTEIFFEKYKNMYPFQVGGIEVAALPLVAAIVTKSVQKGMPVNGFFVRKSRKKLGLMKQVEGEVKNAPIILVDDIINSGFSYTEQVEVIDAYTKEASVNASVVSAFSLIRYCELESYVYFHNKKISIENIFTLNDLSSHLPVTNFEKPFFGLPVPKTNIFTSRWKWKGKKGDLSKVFPRGGVTLSTDSIFFGTDDGYFVCLDILSGIEKWSYLVPFGFAKERVFSPACAYSDLIVFGTHDGNVYALNQKTGKRIWSYIDADWVRGAPCYVEEHSIVIVPLTYGLSSHHGGVVALNATTGKEIWKYMAPLPPEGGVVYSKKLDAVIFGTKGGTLTLLSSKSGNEMWVKQHSIESISTPYVIEEEGLVAFLGASLLHEEKGALLVLDLVTGELVTSFTSFSFWSYGEMSYHDGAIIFAALDKHVYSVNARTGELIWKTNIGARCMAPPSIISTSQETRIYIGANNGRLHELDCEKGSILSLSYFSERIVNKVVYDPHSQSFILPTIANEVYSLQKVDTKK